MAALPILIRKWAFGYGALRDRAGPARGRNVEDVHIVSPNRSLHGASGY